MRYVVLLPSVRRDRGLEGYVEGEGMRVIAGLAREMLLESGRYEVELFWPGFERGPELSMLRRQHEQAELWLRACPGAYAEKIVLDLRSHAGEERRVLGVYNAHGHGRRASRALALAVASELGRATRTRDVCVEPRAVDGAGPEAAICNGQPFTSALVECGSHLYARHARLLSDSPEIVADGIVAGIGRYFEGRQGPGARPGVVWRPGRLKVTTRGVVARSAPSRSGSALRPIGPAVLVTDGYTEGGQRVAGSTRWYHLARECGYGWVHSSAGRYVEAEGE